MKNIFITFILLLIVIMNGFAQDSDENDANEPETTSEKFLLDSNSFRLRSRSDSRRNGTLGIYGEIALGGSLDMVTNDTVNKDESEVFFTEKGWDRDIYGVVYLSYQKPVPEGTLTANFGVDFSSGLLASLIWERMWNNGVFSASIALDSDGHEWPWIVLSSGFKNDRYGIEASAYNDYWSESSLYRFSLLYFRREPDRQFWDYRNNQGYPDPALHITVLKGYFTAFDGQFKIDLCYKEGEELFSDYYRASDIVSRPWDSGDNTLKFSYIPGFMNNNLIAGIAFTHIGINEYFSIKPDYDSKPVRYGALERFIAGVNYSTDLFGASLMFNMGDTGGSKYDFLENFDDELDDGYFQLLKIGSTYLDSKMGINMGGYYNLGNITFQGDLEISGFHHLDSQGMMAAGGKAYYDGNSIFAGFTFRYFNWLGAGDSFGVYGVHPLIGFHIIPETLGTWMQVDYVSGVGMFSGWSYIKFNPRIGWFLNSDQNTYIELGYKYRYDFSKLYDDVTENSVDLKFIWKF